MDSPYEVRVVAFSQHDGNLVAGGTSSGQVVLWDITGRIEELERPEPLTQNQQKFRKRMVSLQSQKDLKFLKMLFNDYFVDLPLRPQRHTRDSYENLLFLRGQKQHNAKTNFS